MLNPTLYLAFSEIDYAERAVNQHICLCRNEDVLLPEDRIKDIKEEDFDKPDNGFNGFELRFGKTMHSFPVGFNRFKDSEPMYGWLHVIGNNPLITREK